ncbi:MAG: glycosyltransferase [Colwellia sp.]|nr:glycosyltransferase [Colwellia sp.]
MKVAIVVDQFPVRSQTFVLNQITGLIDLGIDVDIIALHKGNITLYTEGDYLAYQLEQRCTYLLEKKDSKANKLVYRLQRTLAGLFNPSTVSRVIRSLLPSLGKHALSLQLSTIAANQKQVLSYDWLVCHFGPNGILAHKLRKTGVLSGKIATVFHGFDISTQQSLAVYGKDYQQLFQETELLLPISELWYKKLALLGAAPEKIKVHRMGVDLNEFTFSPQSTLKANASPVTAFSKNTLKIFSVARFTEKKGLKYAIESLRFLSTDISVNYQLAGYGELEQELKLLVNELNLSGKVTFCGPLSAHQVKQFMQEADIFLQPSVTATNGDMEGVPVAIMEAMAIGIPVITTYHSGIPELITNNEHGLLVPERDSQAIADKLAYLHNDLLNGKLIAKTMTIKARERIESIADVKQLNKQLVALLREYH